jgi:hypothetical protein
MHHRTFAHGLLLAAAAPALVWAADPGASCSARAAATAPVVVELYTSEGCSSCPPADRWLSTLNGRADVVALSFHVNYWDKLGWPDPFASAAYTERQRQQMQPSGSAYVYTPQVIASGQDWRSWPKLPAAHNKAAPSLVLARTGDVVTAQIGATQGSLAGYWALVEDGHVSRVRAGENAGETLRHDHVVRRYEPLPAWPATQARQLQWTVPLPATQTPRRVVLVLTDAGTQRPVQALELGC